MEQYLARPIGYSRAEYLSDVVVHVIGVVAVTLLVPILVGIAVFLSDSSAIWGTLIYGSTLSAVIVFSAV